MDEHTQNELGLLIGKIVEQQNQMVLNIQQKNLEQEKMFWNDVRKKLPEEDQNCLICYLEEDGDFIYHRAYFCEGSFRSLENHNSYPLVAELWIPIPECKEVE